MTTDPLSCATHTLNDIVAASAELTPTETPDPVDLSMFNEEWGGWVQIDGGTWVQLEGGTVDGGFICGHCGSATTFSIAAGEPWPPCSGCGRPT